MRIFYWFVVFIFLCTVSPCLANVNSVAFVKSIAGEVYIESGGLRAKAYPYMKIMEGDTIKTGRTGSVGLVFEDDTVLSLGPESEIIIERFLFSPKDKKLSFVANMIKGTFSFITGQIAKLAPKKVKLTTPEATLGVRGTKFLVKVE